MSAATRRYADCSMVRNVTDARCPTPPVCWVQAGCVHEHIQLGSVCREHADMVQRGDAVLYCRFCRQGPESHICQIIGRVISTEEKNRLAGIGGSR